MENEGYNFKIVYDGRTSDGTLFDVRVTEKGTGIYVDEINYTVTDNYIKSDYYKNSFNSTFKECQEVKNKIKKQI